MRDWAGTRVHSDALRVVCPYCRAQVGESCVTERGTVLVAFPAHTVRTRLAGRGSK